MSKNDKNIFYKTLAMSNDINRGEGACNFLQDSDNYLIITASGSAGAFNGGIISPLGEIRKGVTCKTNSLHLQ